MMNNKWRLPHPATMFLLLTLAVIVLSWIFDIYGLSVFQPQTGEEIRVQSLLSPEGVRWLLRHVVTNFTGFAPLGLVIVAMFGIGVAQHSGFIDACIRGGARRKHNPWRMVILVTFQCSRGCRIHYSFTDCSNFVPFGRSASGCRYYYGIRFCFVWV